MTLVLSRTKSILDPGRLNWLWNNANTNAPFLNAKSAPYNAKGDGSTDDTSAVNSLFAALESSGGTGVFPPGTYKGNWTITQDNLAIIGAGGCRIAAGVTNFIPADTSKPVFKFSDGTTACRGLVMADCNVEGAGTGTVGLYLHGIQGSTFCRVGAGSFTDAAVRVDSGATIATYFNSFYDCDIVTDTSASSLGLDIDYGSQYVTAIRFFGGTIGSQAGGSYALQINRAELWASGVWVECGNNRGINLKSTSGAIGSIVGGPIFVDSSASTDVLLNLDQDISVEQVINGLVRIDGKAAMTSGTTAALSGYNLLPYQSVVGRPTVRGPLYLVNDDTAYSSYSFPTDVFVFRTSVGNLQLQAASGFQMLVNAGTVGLEVDVSGNVVSGALSALATTATDGFLYIPSCAGPPTGVPTSFAGKIPLVYDSSNNKLYAYNSGWKGVTLA